MTRKELYDNWVDRVCRFLEETGPGIGHGGKCCGTFQSAPVLGIPHPSQAISNDAWGAIATWLKSEMQALHI